jgi:hypothetical protein
LGRVPLKDSIGRVNKKTLGKKFHGKSMENDLKIFF